MVCEKFTQADHQALTAYVNTLPVIMEQTHENHIMTGQELFDMGYVEYGGQKVEPEKTYIYKYPVLLAANHYRRLKRAWIKRGFEGVKAYLIEVKKTVANHALNNPDKYGSQFN